MYSICKASSFANFSGFCFTLDISGINRICAQHGTQSTWKGFLFILGGELNLKVGQLYDLIIAEFVDNPELLERTYHYLTAALANNEVSSCFCVKLFVRQK